MQDEHRDPYFIPPPKPAPKASNRALPVITRCTGHCCRVFSLPYSPEELQAQKERLVDGEIVAGMVISLGQHRSYPGSPEVAPDDHPGYHFYTCKHFDNQRNVCTAYDSRPAVCRDYPNGRSCKYAGCTSPSARAFKMPRVFRYALALAGAYGRANTAVERKLARIDRAFGDLSRKMPLPVIQPREERAISMTIVYGGSGGAE